MYQQHYTDCEISSLTVSGWHVHVDGHILDAFVDMGSREHEGDVITTVFLNVSRHPGMGRYCELVWLSAETNGRTKHRLCFAEHGPFDFWQWSPNKALDMIEEEEQSYHYPHLTCVEEEEINA